MNYELNKFSLHDKSHSSVGGGSNSVRICRHPKLYPSNNAKVNGEGLRYGRSNGPELEGQNGVGNHIEGEPNWNRTERSKPITRTKLKTVST